MKKSKEENKIKELIFKKKEFDYNGKFNRLFKIIKYEDNTYGFLITRDSFGYFALNKKQLKKLLRFLK